MAGVVIGDDRGPEEIVTGVTVISPLFCKVAPPLRMDWGIGLAVVEILLMSDSTHGAAISGLLSGDLGNVVAKEGHCDTSRTR
jgi:hypothetical protein